MAIETKFTPGPWSLAHFARRSAKCKCGYVLVEGYMGAVATVHASCVATGTDYEHGDNPPMKEAKANARLIAAAPDMFAQLVKMRDEMNCVCKLNQIAAQLGAGVECHVCAINAILAKAGRA